jgi:hypothetical protein
MCGSDSTAGGVITIAVASLVAVGFLTMSACLLHKYTDWNLVAVVYNALCLVAFWPLARCLVQSAGSQCYPRSANW